MPPMLPTAETSQDELGAGKPGQWDKRNWQELSAIARRTRNTSSERTRIEVDLIPDVWARLILFSNALYDEQHLMHKPAVAAFRGVLALLALRSRKNILLKASVLSLDSGNWLFASAARQHSTANHHIHQLYSDTGWNEVYLLKGDGGSLLAISSPLTLICPAQGPSLTGLRALPSAWFNGAEFQDPSAPGVLNDEDRTLLAGWLHELQANLSQRDENRETITWRHGHQSLLKALRTFQDALAAKPPTPNLARENILQLGRSAFQYLAYAVKAEEARLEDSDLLLETSLPLPTPVLLPIRAGDTDVTIEPPTDAAKICVVSGTSLEDIRTAVWGENKKSIAGRPLPGDAQWLDPKTLFLDRLFFLKGTQQSARLLHARGQRDVANELSEYPVLPFSPRLTELLPAAEIARNVRFSVEDHGSGKAIMVRLRLPLKNGRSLEIARAYPNDAQVSMQQMPVLEVWPPFRHPKWRYYSTFWWSNADMTFTAEPFPAIAPIVEQTENLFGGQQKIRVTRLQQPPDGFFLQYPQPGRSRSVMTDAGLLLTNLTTVAAPPTGTWVAGVDFGTSSTNIVLRTGNNYEQPLALAQSGPLRVVVPNRDADRPEALYTYFLPSTPENTELAETSPFLSFLRMRHPDQKTFNEISDAHIFFYSRSHNVQELSAGRLATNLKWEGEAKARSEPYLRQICLQAAAEAVMRGAERINWVYSLPTALTRFRQADYRKGWKSITKFIAEETGLSSTQETLSMTESFAAASYFTHREEAPPVVGAIFVDIGGGTSDISIWQDNTERCGVSIRFAGRDIFLAPLFQLRARLIKDFAHALPDRVPSGTETRLIADQSETEFFAHAEAMLRDAGTSLPKQLQRQDKLDLPALPVRFGIAGIFYYLGLILRHLEAKGLYKRSLGGVFLGGNGAQLLHWADGGEYEPDGLFAHVLTTCLFAGAGWTEKAPRNVQIRLSSRPKQEVATGLVVPVTLRDEAELWDQVIAGEPFSVGGENRPGTDLISREELIQADVLELPELRSFYDTFIRVTEKNGYPRLNLPADALFARALERVRQFMADQKNKEADDVDLVPPFIKGLQALLVGMVRDVDRTRITASNGR